MNKYLTQIMKFQCCHSQCHRPPTSHADMRADSMSITISMDMETEPEREIRIRDTIPSSSSGPSRNGITSKEIEKMAALLILSAALKLPPRWHRGPLKNWAPEILPLISKAAMELNAETADFSHLLRSLEGVSRIMLRQWPRNISIRQMPDIATVFKKHCRVGILSSQDTMNWIEAKMTVMAAVGVAMPYRTDYPASMEFNQLFKRTETLREQINEVLSVLQSVARLEHQSRDLALKLNPPREQ